MRQSRIAGFCFRFPALATVTTTHHMTAQLHVFRSSVATYIVLCSTRTLIQNVSQVLILFPGQVNIWLW